MFVVVIFRFAAYGALAIAASVERPAIIPQVHRAALAGPLAVGDLARSALRSHLRGRTARSSQPRCVSTW